MICDLMVETTGRTQELGVTFTASIPWQQNGPYIGSVNSEVPMSRGQLSVAMLISDHLGAIVFLLLSSSI